MHGQEETDTVVIPHGMSVKIAETGAKRSPYVSRAWSVHLKPASSAYDPCSDCTNCIYGSLRCKRRKVKVRPAVSCPLHCNGSADPKFGQCSGERPGPCQQCASSRQGCIYSQAPRKRRRVSKPSNASKGSGLVPVAFLPAGEEASSPSLCHTVTRSSHRASVSARLPHTVCSANLLKSKQSQVGLFRPSVCRHCSRSRMLPNRIATSPGMFKPCPRRILSLHYREAGRRRAPHLLASTWSTQF